MKESKNKAVLVALGAVTLLIGWRSILEVFSLSIQNNDYTYVLLIVPLSAGLVLLQRQSHPAQVDWDFRLAPALIGVSLAIAACPLFFSHALSQDIQLSINMFALTLAWVGIVILCLGATVARSLLFPLLFLFLVVPPPLRAMNVAVALLQAGSAWSAHVLFSAFGVPVVQNGYSLAIPGLTIQVAEECSSIRSSSMLLLTSMVLAHVFLRSRWRKSLVIGIAIPLSVAKNGLRIFTIAMLGTRANPDYLTGRLHRQGGIVFFLAALLGLLAVLGVCQRRDVRLKAVNAPPA